MAEIEAQSIPVRTHRELNDVHTPHIGDEIDRGQIHLDNFEIGAYQIEYNNPYLITSMQFDGSNWGYKYVSYQWYSVMKDGLITASIKLKVIFSHSNMGAWIGVWNRTTNAILGYQEISSSGEYESFLETDEIHNGDEIVALLYNRNPTSGATITIDYYYLKLKYKRAWE